MTFENDAEFSKLLSRSGTADLVVAALELARDADPQLDFTETLNWIADRAADVKTALKPGAAEREQLEQLVDCLAGHHRLRGNKQAFDDPGASYLPEVIRTGIGLPISLAVLYIGVARAAGIPLDGIGAPCHFLTGLSTSQGRLFLDPFHGGRIMPRPEAIVWLEETTGLGAETIAGQLGPASTRQIISRMLENLRVIHIAREDWPAAWRVQQRLHALRPGSYHDLRDLAIFACRAHRYSLALDHLQACQRTAPASDQRLLSDLQREIQRGLARMN